MSRRAPAALAVALALVLAATAGCGSGSGAATPGDDDAATASSATATPGDATTTPTTTTSRAGAGAAQPSPGCGSSNQASTEAEERTLTVDGTPRTYLLTVPRAHDGDTPVPLVFDFHGLLETAPIQALMSRYPDLAEREGFVVVEPQGTGAVAHWDLHLDDSNPDLAYFDALVDQVESDLCVDEARIYSTGVSMGAMFTTVLLCTRADVLAAAVPVAGLLDPRGCRPSRPVPVHAIHGTADPIVKFNGGFDLSGIAVGSHDDAAGGSTTPTTVPADLDGEGTPAYAAAWAERNGCDPGPTDTQVTDEVVHRVYDCPAGADVELDIVVGGGHAWPGSEFSRSIENVVGHTTFDIDATRDGWDFLQQFST